jgi:phosphatidylglycerophosphatase A
MRGVGAGLRATDPAFVLATWFGVGRLPGGPGTWASLTALPFSAVLAWLGGPWPVLLAVATFFALGLWASGRYIAATGIDDPAPVVVDEVVGQWLALAFLPLTPMSYVVGFILFRIADMAKPWPANWIDRNVAGPWGVMLDDVVAGIYAGAGALILVAWLP